MSQPHDALVRQKLATDLSTSFLVRAPAGSGKTQLLIERYVQALAEAPAPHTVLALTFTKKATQEMKERLQAFFDKTVLPHQPETQIALDKILKDSQHDPLHWRYHSQSWMIMTIDAYFYQLYHRFCEQSSVGKSPLMTQPEPSYRKIAQDFIVHFLQHHPEVILDYAQQHSYKLSILEDHLTLLLALRERWILVKRSENQEKGLISWAQLLHQEQKIFYQLVEKKQCHHFCDFLSAYHPSGFIPQNDFDYIWFLSQIIFTQKGDLRKVLRSDQGFVSLKELSSWHSPEDRQCHQIFFEQLKEILEQQPLVQDFLRFLSLMAAPQSTLATHQSLDEMMRLLCAWYDSQLEKEIDFSDLSQTLVKILDDPLGQEYFHIYCQQHIYHFFIDEAQDLSWSQLYLMKELIQTMAYEDKKSFFIVGDPQQAIYYFRGADVSVFENLRSLNVPGIAFESVVLQENFRSLATLVNFVNSWSAQSFGAYPSIVFGVDSAVESYAYRSSLEIGIIESSSYLDAQQEAAQIAKKIFGLKKEHPTMSIAILARDRASLRPFVSWLLYYQIPFSQQDLYHIYQSEIFQDILATYHILHSHDQKHYWLPFLRSRWLRASYQDIDKIFSTPEKSFWQAIHSQINDLSVELQQDLIPWLDYQKRQEFFLKRQKKSQALWQWWSSLDVAQKLSLADRMLAEKICTFFEQAQGDLDKWLLWAQTTLLESQQQTHQVHLLTIHKSKGLEFDTVFLPNLGARLPVQEKQAAIFLKTPQTLIGSSIYEKDSKNYSLLHYLQGVHNHYEGRRLLYVAMTRAKNRLYFSAHQGANHTKSFLQDLKETTYLSFNFIDSYALPSLHQAELFKTPLKKKLFLNNEDYISWNTDQWGWKDVESHTDPYASVFGVVLHKILEHYEYFSHQKDAADLFDLIWKKSGGPASLSSVYRQRWAIYAQRMQRCTQFTFFMNKNNFQKVFSEYPLIFWNDSKNQAQELRLDRLMQDHQGRWWLLDWKLSLEAQNTQKIYQQLMRYDYLLKIALQTENLRAGVYVIGTQKYYSLEDLAIIVSSGA